MFVKPEKAIELGKQYDNKIYIYNNEAKRNIDTLLYAMEEIRKTQKIRVFFLDNFMQIDINSENLYQEQTNIMEKLRTFAVNKKVHIHLVVHPRKTERFQTRLSLYDVAGSSNIVNKAYNIVSILRVDNMQEGTPDFEKLEKELLKSNYDIKNVSTVLEVLKTKGNGCGLVGLKFKQENRTYEEAPTLPKEIAEKIKNNRGGEQCPF